MVYFWIDIEVKGDLLVRFIFYVFFLSGDYKNSKLFGDIKFIR